VKGAEFFTRWGPSLRWATCKSKPLFRRLATIVLAALEGSVEKHSRLRMI
jgi:hypothetical protein